MNNYQTLFHLPNSRNNYNSVPILDTNVNNQIHTPLNQQTPMPCNITNDPPAYDTLDLEPSKPPTYYSLKSSDVHIYKSSVKNNIYYFETSV